MYTNRRSSLAALAEMLQMHEHKQYDKSLIQKLIVQNINIHTYRRASNDGTFDSTALRHAGSASCEITIFCS